ncbi:MAG: aminotransferase class III-fold pyridoxal phosphate-dependent enzyme [candidate division WOR-3 bacterium]|nr:MAG: aminotransferase class III-fold pyridoxal phosphate-dependent enzyme [candidate division WOR-3 bacterium]
MIEYKSPEISKKARAMMERDEKSMFGAHTRTREIPLVVDHAEGARVTDVDGKTYLDFGAGFAVVGTGHCHPDVINAVNDQMKKLIHISGSDFYYMPQIEVAEKLIQITPGDFEKRVYLGNSGAEAVEASLKIARYFTGRPRMISFLGAFHGRTFAGMTMSGSKKVQRAHLSALIPEVYHIPFPYCYRCVFAQKYPDCIKQDYRGVPLIHCLSYLTDVIFERLIAPDDVSLIMVEPIQGEGGYITPPKEFLPALRKIADDHGITLIFDEIQSGMGRTGRWFACDHVDVAPDIILVAKAIASGLPMSATIGKASLMDPEVDSRAWRPGVHGSTFGGNPVICAAAHATLKIIETKLIDNAHKVGAVLKKGLNEMMSRHKIIGEVRGLGLMLGIELVRDRGKKEFFPPAVTRDGKNIKEVITGECFKRGLIVYGAGISSLRMSPPLMITVDDATTAVKILDEVIGLVEEQLK